MPPWPTGWRQRWNPAFTRCIRWVRFQTAFRLRPVGLRRDKEGGTPTLHDATVANGLAPALESRVHAVYRWVRFRTAFRLRRDKEGGTPTLHDAAVANGLAPALESRVHAVYRWVQFQTGRKMSRLYLRRRSTKKTNPATPTSSAAVPGSGMA